MRDIAREAGVSKNTVSLALRRDAKIPLVTRRRIEEIAKRLGYRKDPTVAHLMVKLRSARAPGYKATLAIFNANSDQHAFTNSPTIPAYVRGCRRRADHLGYTLDEFWLHDPTLNGTRLNRILRSRNIRGGVVVGLVNDNQLPERFLPTWQEFPVVVTGVRTESPTLSFTSTDHHMLAIKAFQEALALGYRRPGLLLDHITDHLTDGRFSSGFHVAQSQVPAVQRSRPFYLYHEAIKNRELFHKWLKKERPDAILTLYHETESWLTDLGLSVPTDMGLIQLEWQKHHRQWAGMEQHNDIVGEAAVDMVISMIHHEEVGIPSFPRSTLIGSTWIPGETIRSHHPRVTQSLVKVS